MTVTKQPFTAALPLGPCRKAVTLAIWECTAEGRRPVLGRTAFQMVCRLQRKKAWVLRSAPTTVLQDFQRGINESYLRGLGTSQGLGIRAEGF